MKILLCVVSMAPLFAQIDLSGVWMPRFHEDQQDRIPGPELGDYLGLPINDGARLSALSWDASRLTLLEEQCRVHAATYIFHGPMAFRSWEEKDPETQRLIAIKQYTGTYQQSRTIWMDGRPHPPAYALHTWMGFSTGKWEGKMLTVTTTHIKQDWLRRNGVPQSDRTSMTEHFIRYGDYLTHVTIIDDPVNLAEPLIRTEDFVLELDYRGTWLYPCDPVEEIATHRKHLVTMHQPGENPFVKEFQTRHNISEQAAMGGPATTSPDFRGKPSPPAPAPRVAQRALMTEDTEIHVQPAQGNVYMLVGPAGNSTVQIGSQGVLIVDTMTAALSEKLLAAIEKLSNKKIQYILNTSADAAHVGGNESLRKAGVTVMDANAPGSFLPTDEGSGAAILAHDNVLKRMGGYPFGAWPTSTLLGDEQKSLFFNGEAINIDPHPAAISDGDSSVFFRRSDVIASGDVFSTTGYPRIDLASRGSVAGVLDALNRIIEIAVPAYAEEGGTLIIPGHGRLCDRSDVVVYRDMLSIVRDRVAAMKKKGLTLQQVQAARPTLDYDPLYGSETGAWTTAMFVEAVYRTGR